MVRNQFLSNQYGSRQWWLSSAGGETTVAPNAIIGITSSVFKGLGHGSASVCLCDSYTNRLKICSEC